MSNTIKIVLSGYYGFDNIGDEAVLYSILSALRKELGNVEVTVLSNNPDKTKALYGVKSVNRWKLKEVAQVIKESDLLISGGGSLLQDVTSSKTVPYYLAIVKIAQFYKKKVVFYSQGIGPVNKGFSRWLIKQVVNKVDGIYVRDIASKNLLEEIGVKKPVGAALDPVLGIEVPQGTAGNQDSKTVGIYIRPWIDEAHDQNLMDSLTPGLVELMEQGYKLCFIPMHYEQDREISSKLAKAVKKAAHQSGKLDQNIIDRNIEIVDKMLSIQEVMVYTSSFEMVIGMRLHSLIMAAASRVPVLALSYDPKVTQFMKEMEVPYCLNTIELTKENFLEILHKVESSKEEQIAHLGKVLESKKERIYLPIKRIKELV
ncbi:MAG: polysaccharide pyruvyl transferase CsaB [Cellulosilyticum sp.]|nr:polysaccharide pyruvyl transferase CsaB [Cellulosilyticum sp.]